MAMEETKKEIKLEEAGQRKICPLIEGRHEKLS